MLREKNVKTLLRDKNWSVRERRERKTKREREREIESSGSK